MTADINRLAGSQRIVVIGTSGAGKTTLARQIAGRLGIPHVELDALHWEANWTPAAVEVFRERVDLALRGPAWTIDGNYSKVRDIIWQRADTVIWLDYSLPLVMSRIVRRTLSRGIRRQELWNGNREDWRNIFKLDREQNIILWSLTTHRRRQRETPLMFKQPEYAHLKIIHLRSPREAEGLLLNMTNN